MNKILKWILGIFPALGGILTAIVLGSKKNKKVNELKTKIKDVNKDIKKAKDQGDALQQTLKSKKKALEEIKKNKEGYKSTEKNANKAADFLKKYANKKLEK